MQIQSKIDTGEAVIIIYMPVNALELLSGVSLPCCPDLSKGCSPPFLCILQMPTDNHFQHWLSSILKSLFRLASMVSTV